MILIEAVAAVLLLLASGLILRAVIAADLADRRPQPAPAEEAPPTYRRAA